MNKKKKDILECKTKLELIGKLLSGVYVAHVCEEYGYTAISEAFLPLPA
jgi:hypothetical protein